MILDEESLTGLLVKYGLTQSRDAIIAAAKPSIRVLLDPQERHVIGASRMGGLPDLPSPEHWPIVSRTRLSFVGQINLQHVGVADTCRVLPSGGILSFFYDIDGMPWGDYSERQCWRVLYFPSDSVRTTQPPSNSIGIDPWPAFSMKFQRELTLPTYRSIERDRLAITESDNDAYTDLLFELDVDDIPKHRLLGHPDGIQGCMQRTVQFESRNLKLPNEVDSYYEHPRANELIPGSFDWQLLLQVDSDDRLGVMWGDAGRIYYWIHRNDLLRSAYDRTWLFLQCS